MKNIILINEDGELLVSSTNDGTNSLYINGVAIPSSQWVGSGNYTATIEGHAITIAKIDDASGNVQLIRNSVYNYALKTAPAQGSGGVTPADYVTEQGTSGNWTYRKWNSGKIEAWFHGEVTCSASTTVGSYYRHSSWSLTIPSAIGFFAAPNSCVNIGGSAASVVGINGGASSATAMSGYAFNATAQSSTWSLTLSIYVWGS